jgi:flagellar basal-body rod modification protein FlgD
MSAIGSAGSSSNSLTSGNAAGSLAGITQDQFLQLLLTQLQNQNPLDPMNTTDFATQLASLSEVGSLDTLNSNFTNLSQVQQLSSANSLVGRTVNYTPTGSTSASSGVVTGVTVQNGSVDLTINNNNIPIGSINSVN